MVTPVERTDDDLLRATLAAVAPGTALRDGLERILRGRTGALIVLGNDKVVESISTRRLPARRRASPPPGCASCPRWTARSSSTATSPRSCAPTPAGPRPEHRDVRVRHPAPHRGAGRQADRLPRRLGQPVDADHRALRRRPAARPRGQRQHPVQGEPGPADARALQVAASTRSPAPCRPWRSRTSSPSATSPACCSASRWSAGSARRSPTTSSSSATTAACSPSSSRSWPAVSATTASWSSATTSTAPSPAVPSRRRSTRSWSSPPPSCSTSAAGARAVGFTIVGDALDSAVSPRGLPPAHQGPAAARRRSSTASSTTSSRCRGCSRPTSRTS